MIGMESVIFTSMNSLDYLGEDLTSCLTDTFSISLSNISPEVIASVSIMPFSMSLLQSLSLSSSISELLFISSLFTYKCLWACSFSAISCLSWLFSLSSSPILTSSFLLVSLKLRPRFWVSSMMEVLLLAFLSFLLPLTPALICQYCDLFLKSFRSAYNSVMRFRWAAFSSLNYAISA